MLPKHWITIGGIVAAVGVALGAFGAHGLPGWLEGQQLAAADVAKRLEWFDVAVRYHYLHAVALVLVGLIERSENARRTWLAGGLFVAGLVLFSGLLYVMTLTGLRWLGAIVPLGGLSFIAGWLALAWRAQRVGN